MMSQILDLRGTTKEIEDSHLQGSSRESYTCTLVLLFMYYSLEIRGQRVSQYCSTIVAYVDPSPITAVSLPMPPHTRNGGEFDAHFDNENKLVWEMAGLLMST